MVSLASTRTREKLLQGGLVYGTSGRIRDRKYRADSKGLASLHSCKILKVSTLAGAPRQVKPEDTAAVRPALAPTWGSQPGKNLLLMAQLKL